MTTDTTRRPMTVALLGNPNTGKSTLFSALVGVRQRTGNYPGVTVEKKVGRTTIGETACDVIDLPGTYSLAPHSPDEMVASTFRYLKSQINYDDAFIYIKSKKKKKKHLVQVI